MGSHISIFENIANIIDSVFEISFLLIFLGKRKNMPYWVFGICSICMITITVIAQFYFPGSMQNTAIYLVFGLLFALVCIRGNLWQKILYFTIWNIMLMVCSILYASAYGFIKRNVQGNIWDMSDTQRIRYLLGLKLLLILLFFVAVFLLRKEKLNSAMPVMNITVFVISILIGIILDIMLDYEYLDMKGKMAIGVAIMGILAINIFVYIATYQLNRNQQLLMENQLLRMSQEEQKESMQRMMELQEKNRILRHDLRHYFTVFQEMLAHGEIEEAKRYADEVINTKLQAEGVYMTGDKILDAVLNHNDSVCKSKGIAFHAEVSAHLPERQMEFAIALMNLLENAIEAEEQEKDKNIDLEIYESAGMLLVTVRNRISQSVMKKNPEFKTRKENSKLHGLGRKSVKTLIEDLDGTFYEEEKEGYFVSNIVVKC